MPPHDATMAMTTRTGASAASASYDLRRNPPYQIDMTAAQSGKRLAQTKRRVRWRFGFSNAEALAEGGTGTDCRGEEHDVTLVWSLTSGKRLVLADGKEVHFSMGKPTSGKFQTSWTMRGNHVLKIIAYAAPPLKAKHGFKQFELFLDGMPFNTMPKIYELGVKRGGGGSGRGSSVVPYEGSSSRGGAGGSSSRDVPYNNYALPREEEMAWAQNVERYEEQRSMDRQFSEREATPAVSAPTPAAPPAPSADFMSDPVAVPGQDILSEPAALLDYAPTPAQPTLVAPPAQDEFAPQAPPPPTYNDVAGSILNQYGGGEQQPPPQPQQQNLPALPPSTNYEQPPPPQQTQPQYYEQQPAAAVVSPPQGQQQQFAVPPPAQQYYEQQPPQQPQQQYYAQPPPQQSQPPPQPQYGVVTPESAAPQYSQPPQQQEYETPVKSNPAENLGVMVPVPPADDTPDTNGSPKAVDQIDDVSQALKNLVNINDITEKPEQELELTMSGNPFDDKNKLREDQRKVKKGVVKSRGLAPTTENWAMSNKCLAEVKDSVAKRVPTKEVMKPHAFDPAASAAGMMVVYGAPAPPPPPQQQYYAQQGPPPQQQYYAQQAAAQPPPPQHDYSQGPPPLGHHAAGGFGVGAQMPGGGYSNQQPYAAR